MRLQHAALLLALALASTASAQSTIPPHMVGIGKSIEWPAALGSGTFGRVLPARLTPYSGQGVVLDWNDGLVYANAPHVLQQFIDLGMEPEAWTVLRGDIDNGVLDKLVVSTSSGLSVTTFDGSNGGIDFTTTALANTSAAADAVALCSADFTDDGLMDIAAVCGDRQTVLVYRGTESGNFVLDSSFTQTPLISEIQPIQWTTASGHSGLEIAARSNLGVRVHSRTGTVLFAQLTGTTEHDMAVVPPYVARIAPYTTVETLDKLAIVAPDSGDDEIFRLYGSAGNEQAFSLGEIGVVGMHAGDYDQDGDFDLAVSQCSSHRLWIMRSRCYDSPGGEKDAADPTFTSDAGDRNELRIGEVGSAAMPNNTAWPLLADLTGDGLTDVLMGVHDEDSQKGGDFLYRVRGEVDNNYADEGECPGTFNEYWLYIDGSLSYPNVGGEAVTNSGQLAIEIELNNTWGYLGNANPSDIFLEVTVRKQDECEDEEVEISPIWHHLYSVDVPNGAGEAFLSQSAPLRIGFSIDVDTLIVEEDPLEYGYVEFGDKYYMEIRPARYTNGDIWSPFSSEILSFTGEFETMTTLGCAPTPHLSNDPGAYLDCIVTGEIVPGAQDYIAEAYAQANLPAFGGGFMLYPPLSHSTAKAPAGQ